MTMIFDTHAHYDDEAFKDDRAAVINGIYKSGVTKLLNAASSLKSIEGTIRLMKEYDWIYGSVGVHPSDVKELSEESFQWLSEMLIQYKYNTENTDSSSKAVAVGEIGLDYYWKDTGPELQKYWFERQLKLAADEDMPVIIHSREAAADTLMMIKDACAYAKKQNKELSGVIHCFSYGKEMAQEYIKMGFYIGITGVITFKNAKKLVEAVENIPIDRIVVETDAPYLAPEPNRGKRNTSENLPYIIERIAQIKGISLEETKKAVYDNAVRLYRIYNKLRQVNTWNH